MGYLNAGQTLPVFLADNHAETFGWIARTFDPDEPHVLVLVDAHSDASMAERSEEIREGLRRVPSEAARDENVRKLREQGRIQAFNWLEPLMARPVDHVCWVAGWNLADSKRVELHREAVESLDGRLEVEPRSVGSLADRWTTMNSSEFLVWDPGQKRVILAIDLDFFTGMEVGHRDQVFEHIWKRAMHWPGLAGVAFSVSRPWLKNDEEADALVRLASAAVARTRGAIFEIDASVDDRPDESKRKLESLGPLDRWDAVKATDALRTTWLGMRGRLTMLDRKRDWNVLLDQWSARGSTGVIRPDQGEIDCDGVWRYALRDAPVLRVDPPAGATGRVRWFALEPAHVAYDLLPETGLGKSFSVSPGRWVYETRRALGDTKDYALAAESWRPGGAGRIRIEAEVETAGGWIPVLPIEIRLADGVGFRGALSECFGMPYVFGVSGVAEDDLSGVESGWGSDCANLLMYAWRRNGVPLSWGDPGRLRAQLAAKAEDVTLDHVVVISVEEIKRGIAIDFGRHVAAVWEDREPVGKLDGNDLVVHHLGGTPEMVELSDLTKNRPVFSLRVPRTTKEGCVVKMAGDVVLAGNERDVVDGFEKGDADLFLVNLEGVPSQRVPEQVPRFDFRFPKEHLVWMREQGVDAVSLANNHAGDAGPEGLVESLERLREAGIGCFGAGKNEQEACRPWRVEHGGVRLAVFGVSLVEAMAATEVLPGVARLPDHENLLDREIRTAAGNGEVVIVLVHGGDEYQSTVNEDQRRWGRWLVSRGVRLIGGSHPHVIQRTEWHGGAVIAHSLGNAVYPKRLAGAGAGELRAFRIFGKGLIQE